MRKRHPAYIAGLVVALWAAAILPGTPATAGPTERSAELRAAVTKEGVFDHMEKFQRIADEFGGTRVSGTPGYGESARYIKRKLRRNGYEVTAQHFRFIYYEEVTPAEFEQVEPNEVTYEKGEEFETMTYSGSGDVTRRVTAVDLDLGLGNESSSGCEDSDFSSFPEGRIALIQRGTCSFNEKAVNADEAGATGVIIFNQGEVADDDRQGVVQGTLGQENLVDFPVIGISYDLGVELNDLIADGLRVRLFADTFREERGTQNVFAETPTGDDSNVVMAGAHLDSVAEGPGINDNGSGSAALLEIALEMADLKIKPNNTVRFAWWGAEESGLVGSNLYIEEISDADHAKIALYLNFDMIGSPNFARFIYDGNGSAFPDVGGGPEGSGAIERTFQRYFETKGLASSPTAFDGRSDYQAFILTGIPAGGLFTGAEGHKTEQEADIYGGTSGEQYDPCYHEACDDIDNVSKRALGQMSDAIAHTIYTFAMSTKSVNGVE